MVVTCEWSAMDLIIHPWANYLILVRESRGSTCVAWRSLQMISTQREAHARHRRDTCFWRILKAEICHGFNWSFVFLFLFFLGHWFRLLLHDWSSSRSGGLFFQPRLAEELSPQAANLFTIYKCVFRIRGFEAWQE